MKTFNLSTFTLFVSCLSSVVLAGIDSSGISIQWGYKGNIGPERWGQLSPAFQKCSMGKEQSPINITKSNQESKVALRTQYHPSEAYVMEDGATDLLLDKERFLVNTGHGVQLNFHANSNEIVTLNNDVYRLIQFHFHSPSEDRLYGQSFPLEIHFVHQSDKGKVAVIGVFVKAGSENKTIKPMIDLLPIAKGKEMLVPNAKFNPAELLPETNTYYTFAGSLTTPPCNEGLQWVVLPVAITASPAQIAVIRKESGGMNARPIQPLNHRKIYYSTKDISSH